MPEPAVRVEGLVKRYGTTTAVDGVGFSVAPGEVVGLLGPNGAGKTTTIKCIATLVRPNAGEIWIDGADAVRHPHAALERVSAVLEGNRNIYWRLSVRENLQFFAGLHGIPARVARPHIADLVDLFHLGIKADAEARLLSRGMQQKLAIAC